MDLHSSELPDEMKKIVKEDTVKKTLYYEKTANLQLSSWNAWQKW